MGVEIAFSSNEWLRHSLEEKANKRKRGSGEAKNMKIGPLLDRINVDENRLKRREPYEQE